MKPLKAFLGISGGASISNASPTQSGVGAQTAAYNLNSDGSISGSGLAAGTWLKFGAAGDYDARWDYVSGSLGGGSVAQGIWQQLSTSFVVSLQESSVGTATETVTVKIRRRSSGLVITSASINLTATRTS